MKLHIAIAASGKRQAGARHIINGIGDELFIMKSSNTAIIIRIGNTADAPPLSLLAAKLFRQTYQGSLPAKDLESHIALDFSTSRQEAELGDSNITTLLLERENQLIGYAQLRRKPIPVDIDSNASIELWRIYLDQSCHGLGLGHGLLSRVGQEVRAMSSDLVWLGVWGKNSRAISFYENHGFQAVGSQQFRLGSDVQEDIVMLARVTAF